jgi:hypothetical protein
MGLGFRTIEALAPLVWLYMGFAVPFVWWRVRRG